MTFELSFRVNGGDSVGVSFDDISHLGMALDSLEDAVRNHQGLLPKWKENLAKILDNNDAG